MADGCVGGAETVIGTWPMGIAMARDFAGYLGLAPLVRWAAGPGIATLTVTLVPFVCASFGIGVGVGVGHDPAIWAWPLHDSRSVTASGIALTLLLGGLAATLLGPHRGR